tara:strand:- start:53200 stop:53418 length:219 start_codon:yes stop_codon:yes gene_type:complete
MPLAIISPLPTPTFDLSLIMQVKLKNEIHKETSIACDKKTAIKTLLGPINALLTDIKTVIIIYGFQFILDIR